MLKDSKAFSGFAVRDLDEAKRFYGQTLGLDVQAVEGNELLAQLNLAGGTTVLVYPKPDHEPATYTVLNFPVPDVTAAVRDLKARGVPFESYDGDQIRTDEDDIMRGNGPSIAWFRDPSGNILSVVEMER
jgi:catechol 2,3-dioxygenase-like lactoylglutathione lyase family enzyme